MANLFALIQRKLRVWMDEIIMTPDLATNQDCRNAKVKEFKQVYKRTSYYERKDNLVPADSQYFRIDATPIGYNNHNDRFEFLYDWPSNDGFAENPGDATLKAGDQFDRIGSSEGTYVCRLKTNGESYQHSERSLPYCLLESCVRDEPAYHCYLVIVDFSQLASVVNKKAKLYPDIKREYYKGEDDRRKIKEGSIAEWKDCSGGGIQIKLPLSVASLEELGMIKELS